MPRFYVAFRFVALRAVPEGCFRLKFSRDQRCFTRKKEQGKRFVVSVSFAAALFRVLEIALFMKLMSSDCKCTGSENCSASEK